MVIIYSKLFFTVDVLPVLLFVVIVKAAKGRWQVNQCNHNLTIKLVSELSNREIELMNLHIIS